MAAVKLNDKYEVALRLLRRKNGVTVEKLAEELELPNTKAARGIVDRFRVKGVPVKNVGQHTFKVRTRANPARSA